MRACTLICFSIWFAASISTPAYAHSYMRHAEDRGNLQKIGNAAAIYAAENRDRMPAATDVWDYARLLAERGWLTDPRIWQSRTDPAYVECHGLQILVEPSPTNVRRINPEFLNLKPALAIALGKLTTSSGSSTPIAWTRGLQTDGTWAKHSPYGDEGGFILYLGGQINFYSDLKQDGGQLIRYKDGGRTANILEALPPGTRISEYEPTPDEKAAWSAMPRQRFTSSPSLRRRLLPNIVVFGIVCLPFVIIAVKRLIQRRRLTIGLLLWPAFLCVVFAIVVPSVC